MTINNIVTQKLHSIREKTFISISTLEFRSYTGCAALCCSRTHLPPETLAKLVNHDGKPWKKSVGLAPCQKCNYLPVCVYFFSRRQLDQQALWIFDQKLEKLSAMRHHLPRPSWPCFLSSLAMPDKPLEGLSACGNGWAILQRTQGVR